MRYHPSLDGIRGLSISFVMLNHIGVGFLPGGYHGVDMFFVLSGYVITNLLYREIESTGTILFFRFYWHRFLRLGPPLLIFLITYLILATFVFQFMSIWQHLIGVLCFRLCYAAHQQAHSLDSNLVASGGGALLFNLAASFVVIGS
jgi:peptidoglycan/LPS O-acetylase OafA/YrhL